MKKAAVLLILVPIAVILLVLIMLDRNLNRIQNSQPTWQDDATAREAPNSFIESKPNWQYEKYGKIKERIGVWEVSNIGIGGLPSDTLSIEGKITTFASSVTLDLEYIDDITVRFDGKEFWFSVEEFKAVIENARADSVYVGKIRGL